MSNDAQNQHSLRRCVELGLVRGYTLNEKRLQENKQRLKELEAAVELVGKAKSAKTLSGSETAGLLTVITEYTRSWLLLHQYDAGTLATKELHREVRFRITDDDAKKAKGCYYQTHYQSSFRQMIRKSHGNNDPLKLPKKLLEHKLHDAV